jgi:hypothetical protein
MVRLTRKQGDVMAAQVLTGIKDLVKGAKMRFAGRFKRGDSK